MASVTCISLCPLSAGIFALVLTPTRELALQIADQFRLVGRPIGLQDAVVIGGQDMVEQGAQLQQRPHVVIATPGRWDRTDAMGGMQRECPGLVIVIPCEFTRGVTFCWNLLMFSPVTAWSRVGLYRVLCSVLVQNK